MLAKVPNLLAHVHFDLFYHVISLHHLVDRCCTYISLAFHGLNYSGLGELSKGEICDLVVNQTHERFALARFGFDINRFGL